MSRWPLVPLGEVMRLALDPHPVQPEASYPIAGIYGFGRGMLRRPAIRGSGIGAKQLFRIRAGQFIYSKLKSFEGAFALVTEDADGCYVSNEFPSFDFIPGRVAPAFVGWYFKQERVWRQLAAEGRGVGARRERLHPERVLEHRIPLPPLAEQERVVARLDAVAGRLTQRRARVEAVEVELAAGLRAAFDRIAAHAPRARLGDVAPLVRREVEIDPERSYTELGVRSFYKGTFHRRTVSGTEFTWQRLFLVAEGDLLFSNLMAWEQAIAVAGPQDEGCVGNHRILTCQADRERVEPSFLWHYFATAEGFAQILEASSGSIARNKTLSTERLPLVTVPLPSLDAQRWFDALQAKAAAARRAQAAAAGELGELLPALLRGAFDGAGATCPRALTPWPEGRT